MKHIYFFGIFLLTSAAMQAQVFVELACGANYAQQAYYRLSDDQTTKLDNASWDLAFTANGSEDAGILINESSAASFTTPLPEFEAYAVPVEFFEDYIDQTSLEDRRYNDEKSWLLGALNTDKDPMDSADFGWGKLDPMTNIIYAEKVWAFKLRNGEYKKFIIDSLVGTTYYIRWADLDGSNLQSMAIDKNDHMDAGFAYLSIQNKQILANPPVDWDFFWGRHTDPLDDGNGGFIEYMVTGVLTGPGIQVAEADGVDVETVDYVQGNYADSLSDSPKIIDHDWKYYDFSTGWNIDFDRAFFVKTRDDHVWKIIIVDFEGSSTGNMVFEKTDLGVISALEPVQPSANSIQAGPNPARPGDPLMVQWTGETGPASFSLVDLQGRQVWSTSTHLQPGFQQITNTPSDLIPGMYILQVQQGDGLWVGQWVIR
ncbi:MAG: T9SS type A sorting domain-containing protein [Saprospiraceae bacterium]|nr:T9SS type A sorting domain-containing protein [Saprospiraceae bacterium]